jgi:hypothetical protein
MRPSHSPAHGRKRGMRVDFIGHATLLIRHGNLSLLTDPWWSGPAYRDQWYPYPIPVPERYDLKQVGGVYISHSHEDHLHAPTLRALLAAAPHALAIIPQRYDTHMRDYVKRIGFRHIKEAGSGTPFTLRKGSDAARLTLLTHMDDSLLGVEAGGEVLLNVNDALHSSRRELILEYCRILRHRFPRIDYLFCGFGGASYFPNCVHVPGKDDVAIARAREQWFLQNFALISDSLRPRHAFPFAAHFVLPDERTWWISATRLQLEAPAKTLRRLAPDVPVAFHDLRPGDFIEDGEVHQSDGASTAEPDAVRAAVLAHYGPPRPRAPIGALDFDELVSEIRARVEQRGTSMPVDAVLVLTDFEPKVIRVQVTPGQVRVESADRRLLATTDPQVVVETRADLVRSTLRTSFGKDLICIGYGAEVHLRSQADLACAPHERVLQLLAPVQPRWRQHLRERPVRTMRFLIGDPSMRLAAAKRLLRVGSTTRQVDSGPAPYDIGDWITVPEG